MTKKDTFTPEQDEMLTAMMADAIPVRQLSPVVHQFLIDNGLISEADVAAMRGEKQDTTRQRRSRGHMPPHLKWGNLVVYRQEDIAADIRGENATGRRDILGAA